MPMNEFMVSMRGDDILICRFPVGPLTKDQALNLAAWLVAIADYDCKFDDVLMKVILLNKATKLQNNKKEVVK